MKRVLLIGPSSNTIRSGQFLAPPLGVHRIASYLQDKADIDVVDPSLDKSDVYEALASNEYDVIGHSVLHTTLEHDLSLLYDSKQMQPDAIHVLGGQGTPTLSDDREEIIVSGAGEKPFEKILQGDHTKRQFGKLTDEEFHSISTSFDFEAVPYELYWNEMEKHYTKTHRSIMKTTGMLRTVRLMTSNYCPMGCTFCSSTNFLNEEGIQPVMQLSADEVIHVMDRAVQAHPQTEAFYFNDDDFMLHRPRLQEICSGLETRPSYNLMCMGRVDDVDETLLDDMKEAGFKIIFYGVETFSDTVAKDIHKTKKDNYSEIAHSAITKTLSAGITPQTSLILFLPTANERDLETTIEHAVDLVQRGSRLTVFSYAEAYPGATMLHEHDLMYKTFEVGDETMTIPDFVLPDSEDVYLLSQQALQIQRCSDQQIQAMYGEVVPQPISALHLFRGVYHLLGKSTYSIDRALHTLHEGSVVHGYP